MLYGDGFPDFIAGFPPAAAIPFLADVARAGSLPYETAFDGLIIKL